MPTKKYKSHFFGRMGLVVSSDWAMMYGFEHGALCWAPEWFKHGVCHVWNKVACAIRGHDDFGLTAYTSHVIPGRPKCCYCCAEILIDGKRITDEELEIHNEICYTKFENDMPVDGG
jgi:hypothetical protein